MRDLILSPPGAFVVILAVSWLMSYLSSYLSFRRKGDFGAFNKAYASGEDIKKHRVQPDYGQFFPFAFFFTILHVATMLIATAPKASFGSIFVAGLYILGAMLGLYILFRGEA